MQIDPKVSMWLNIVMAVLGAVMGAGAQLTTIFGQGQAQAIISLSGLIVAVVGSINGALHSVSSPDAGPAAKGN